MKKKLALAVLMGAVLTCTGTISACSTTENSENSEVTEEKEDTSEVQGESATEIEYPDELEELEMMATVVFGEISGISGSGIELLEENTYSIIAGGVYEFSGTLEDGMIFINTEDTVEIRLNGASITNSAGPVIYGENAKDLYISTVEGTTNVLQDGTNYETDEAGEAIGKGTIFSNDDIYFLGAGSLTVNGNYKHAICSDDSVFVEGGTLTLAAVKDGINANDTLMVDGGEIVIADAYEGLEGTFVIVNEGSLDITVSDDAINAAADLQVNGGMLYAICTTGDALDSNGSMELTGGVVVVHGGEMPEGGLDCDQSVISITGGTIIATGGTNSSPSEDNSQYSILLGSANAGSSVGILDEAGNTVFAFASEISYTNMVVSIAGIEADATYTVYTDGTISGSDNFHGFYADGVYEGGTESQTFTADSMVISAGGTAGMMGGGFGGGRGNKGEFGQQFENGEMPEKMTVPEGTEMPEGMEMPEDLELPEDAKPSEEIGRPVETPQPQDESGETVTE